MIRYAAHKVLLLKTLSWFNNYAVELDDNGCITQMFPLDSEIHHTVWKDGALIIADGELELCGNSESFAQYIHRMHDLLQTDKSDSCMLFHVDHLSVSEMEFTPHTVIRRLV